MKMSITISWKALQFGRTAIFVFSTNRIEQFMSLSLLPERVQSASQFTRLSGRYLCLCPLSVHLQLYHIRIHIQLVPDLVIPVSTIQLHSHCRSLSVSVLIARGEGRLVVSLKIQEDYSRWCQIWFFFFKFIMTFSNNEMSLLEVKRQSLGKSTSSNSKIPWSLTYSIKWNPPRMEIMFREKLLSRWCAMESFYWTPRR